MVKVEFIPPPPQSCPDCGNPMVLRETSLYKFSDTGENRKFLGCSSYPTCKTIITLHSNGQILGTPVDKETRQLRIDAHNVFDTLWKEHGLKRSEAYTLLKDIMDMQEAPHIGHMDKAQLKILIKRVSNHIKQNF